MLFSSPIFIFIFLPTFLILFFFTGTKYRDYVLLLASVSFYFWGEPVFCLVAIASALLDYWLCKRIVAGSITARRYLVLGVVANLLLLFYYKYTNFFLNSMNQLLPYHFDLLDIILPIGVSFIVFEKITYLVDVYRGVGKQASSVLTYLNYVFLFPKLLAGPIIKYHEIEKQLHARGLNADDIAEGFKRFFRGIIKKVFIADTCAEVVNQVFALPDSQLGFGYAWLGIVCFTLQIYFDFSGYSDMALGLARMLGFTLRENFNMPYIATSFTEFWRRWHISLSTWIREYLYLPLGGNRLGKMRMYVNLWLCFLLSGLWHGANWTFVLWGAYNGFFLILDKLFWLKISTRFPRILSALCTLPFIMFGWVIFRASHFTQLRYYTNALLHPSVQSQAYIDITPNITAAIIIGSVLALIALMPGFKLASDFYANWKWRTHSEGLFIGSLGFFAVCKIIGVTFVPFLYFRF